jgi:hypothetical protein
VLVAVLDRHLLLGADVCRVDSGEESREEKALTSLVKNLVGGSVYTQVHD